MFLVNSRHPHFSAALVGLESKSFTLGSTPSSEVTGSFCRVPWPEFSRAPWIIHPTHLSWFAVRFAHPKLRRFSRQYRLNSFRPYGHGLASRRRAVRICLYHTSTCLHRDNQHPACLPFCVPPSHRCTSTRILTRFPSATPFSLTLGTD